MGARAPVREERAVVSGAVRGRGAGRRGAAAVLARVAGHRDALAVAAIVLVTALVYWRMLQQGGLFFDDWWHRAAAVYNNEAEERTPFFGYFAGLWELTGFRPTLVPVLAFEIWVAGGDPTMYQALAMADTLFAAIALYVALRVARVPWGACTAAAVVFACLPIAGATRFWLAGAIASVALGFVLFGLAAGGAALRATGRRALVLHAASVLLIASGALAYDAVLGLLALLLPFYLAATGLRWRASLVKTAVDGAATVLVLLIFHTRSSVGADPVSAWWAHAKLLAGNGTELFFGVLTIDRATGALVVLVLLAASLFLAVKIATDPAGWWAAARPQLRRTGVLALLLIAGGYLAALAGYAAYVPAGWYDPLKPGQGDRTNGVASAGFAIAYAGVALGLAVLLGTALRGRASALLRGGLLGVLVALASVSFIQQSRAKGDQYIRAWEMSEALLAGVAETFPDGPPPDGAMIYSFGAKAYAAPLVQALGDLGDLDGGVKLTLGTGRVGAMPIYAPQPVVCATEGVLLPTQFNGGPGYTKAYHRRYGRVWFMDAFQRMAEPIPNQAACERALTRYRPGPL